MISKQTAAFAAGVLAVTLCLAAYVVYENSHSGETESDATNPPESEGGSSGSGNGSHARVDNSEYNLRLVSCKYSDTYGWVTSFTMDVKHDTYGYYTAFVGDVQYKLDYYSSYVDNYELYVSPGEWTIGVTIRGTDPGHSGIALLEETTFVYTPLEIRTDYSYSVSEVTSGSNEYTKISFDGDVPDRFNWAEYGYGCDFGKGYHVKTENDGADKYYDWTFYDGDYLVIDGKVYLPTSITRA